MHTLPTALTTVLRVMAGLSPAARERLLDPAHRGQLRALLLRTSLAGVTAGGGAHAAAHARIG